jgi:hypothetical protein
MRVAQEARPGPHRFHAHPGGNSDAQPARVCGRDAAPCPQHAGDSGPRLAAQLGVQRVV